MSLSLSLSLSHIIKLDCSMQNRDVLLIKLYTSARLLDYKWLSTSSLTIAYMTTNVAFDIYSTAT